MPVKRRTEKAVTLSAFHREMLMHGPESVLLAGVGFMEGRRAAVFAATDESDQLEILNEMRAAWRRHGSKLVREWGQIQNAGTTPWASKEFGSP